MNSRTFLVCMTSVLFGLCSMAYADDLTPPPWRGTLGSTFSHWGFNQPSTGPQLPDNGWQQVPTLTSPPILEPGWEWLPEWQGRLGVLCMNPGQTIRFLVPNYDHPDRQKEIRVQLTWWSSVPQTRVEYRNGGSANGSVISTNPLGNGWNHSRVDVFLPDCPPNELVNVTNLTNTPIYLDQVVIDTRCVPEPASLVALGLGVAAMIRRRKRA